MYQEVNQAKPTNDIIHSSRSNLADQPASNRMKSDPKANFRRSSKELPRVDSKPQSNYNLPPIQNSARKSIPDSTNTRQVHRALFR
jgi:hypothetical protein